KLSVAPRERRRSQTPSSNLPFHELFPQVLRLSAGLQSLGKRVDRRKRQRSHEVRFAHSKPVCDFVNQVFRITINVDEDFLQAHSIPPLPRCFVTPTASAFLRDRKSVV